MLHPIPRKPFQVTLKLTPCLSLPKPSTSSSPEPFQNPLNQHSFEQNYRHICYLLLSFTRSRSIPKGLQLHAHIIKSGFQTIPLLSHHLINFYSKSQLPLCSCRVFHETPRKSSTTWSSVISSLAQNERPLLALDFFRGMLVDGLRPDDHIYPSATKSCAILGRCHMKTKEIYQKLEELGEEMEKAGYVADTSFVLRKVDALMLPFLKLVYLVIFLALITLEPFVFESYFWVLERNVFKKDELGLEIAHIALPSALALTADPIASLIDTAFIGHIEDAIETLTHEALKHVELGKGISFNKELEMEELSPLVDSASLTSSTSRIETETLKHEQIKRHIPSASSALVIASMLGLVQALFLIMACKPILNYMGVDSNSPVLNPARQYLTLRSLSAPAVLLSLAMQGVFRGMKDTKTPLYATMVGDVANIILDPILIFTLHMGVSGAAIAHVISQLMKLVTLLPPSIKDLQFGRFLKNGALLLMRVIAATFCVTLAASLAARQGSTSMAAFQVCLQLWLATSLLADGLAVAGQAILASAFARKDYSKATATASRVLQLGLVLGLVLSVIIAVVLQCASRLFTKDIKVLQLMSLGIPFVALTQPISALAFVLMESIMEHQISHILHTQWQVLVAIVSIWCLFVLSSTHGFVGIWIALSLYMSFRALVGFWRIGTGTGPWRFLRD
ncbi:hypothetical protein FEM48_Zijuj12G0093300 [Ziziphus jujuba var. spinosa]|uniref:Protein DETOXIFICATION n=1 Tax=Ziziphus jujuba var. spinosa TaxID=714518 RepID=A0A978UCG9_ZIZJJ|nr:hypothetical protein FEM48_Zijuj12G0093300 [Ziziphus jujuba var. spinosa]